MRCDPGVGLGVHDDDEVELVRPALVSLDQEGHVVDDHGIRIRGLRGGEELVRARPHGGVGDRVELLPSARVLEHDPAEGRPVERAVGRDDVRAEHLGDALQRRHPGLDDLASHAIGVDHDRAVLLQPSRDHRFAGSDPTGEGYEQHVAMLVARAGARHASGRHTGSSS